MTECANIVIITDENPVVKISQPQEAVVLIEDSANVVDITCDKEFTIVEQNSVLVKVTETVFVPIIKNSVVVIVSEDFLLFTTEGGLLYTTLGALLLKKVA